MRTVYSVLLLLIAPSAAVADVLVAAPASLAVYEGEPFAVQLTATGGVSPYAWDFDATPPEWISLSQDGLLAAEMGEFGGYTLYVCATDQRGERGCARIDLDVRRPEELGLNMSTLPVGWRGIPYQTLLSARGGRPPYALQITGDLPRGMHVSIRDGRAALGGIPDVSGRFPLHVTVHDTEPTTYVASLELIILEQPRLVILTDTLPPAFVQEPYNTQLEATLADAVWTVIDGELPDGIELSESGELSGIPTDVGRYTFLVQVEGRDGLARSGMLLTVRVRTGGGGGYDIGGGGGDDVGGGGGGQGGRDQASSSGHGTFAPTRGCGCGASGEGGAGACLLLAVLRRRSRGLRARM